MLARMKRKQNKRKPNSKLEEERKYPVSEGRSAK